MPANICVSVAGKTYADVVNILELYDFAEVRLDLTDMDEGEIRNVFSTAGKQLIATCRKGQYNDNDRIDRLITAIKAGAVYVDIEIEENLDYQQNILGVARQNNCKLIVSHHDFEGTPDREKLNSIIANCRQLGADVVKLVTTARIPADSARVLSLYDGNTDLLAFAMGEAGRISRFACLYLGAPFTYVSVSDKHAVSNGQISANVLQELIQLLAPV
ncbi:MAG: type I 3-dehydroquinate dehydratase [Prevotellaceae bacterium]|nr:type I 3-dehydroquinate dehydratase [Prevotellaceae bacterium]